MGGITGTGADSLLGLGNSSLLAQLASLRSGPFGSTSQHVPHTSMPSSLLAPTMQSTAHDFGNVLANASDQRSGLIHAPGGWPNIPLRDQLSDAARTALIRELLLQQQLSAFPSVSSSYLPAGAAVSRLDGSGSHHSALGALVTAGGGGHVVPHDNMSLPSPAAPPISSELIQHFLRRQIERDSPADQASSTGGSNSGGTSTLHPNSTSL
jgi:hypothetical protein